MPACDVLRANVTANCICGAFICDRVVIAAHGEIAAATSAATTVGVILLTREKNKKKKQEKIGNFSLCFPVEKAFGVSFRGRQ